VSTEAIILVVIAALVIIAALAFLAPNMRNRKYERELGRRREEAADRHRDEAQARASRAEQAERRAREERVQADQAERQAALHEEGRADHELVGEDDDPRLVEHATTDTNGEGRFTRENADDTVRTEQRPGY
jgi:flagellar biosynthesis/type III secretory pathway M-ring protein FliF/YscJ